MATAQYFQNPDFEEIFVFQGLEVPTSKKEFKQLDEEMQLKITTVFPEISIPLFRKGNGTRGSQDFISTIKNKLTAKRKRCWPYKQKLLLTVGVTGIKKVYGGKDLDNLLKSIFDAFKGIVFEDDNQIEIVIAFKQILAKDITGFTVGLRILKDGVVDKYLSALYSNDYQKWGPDYIKKFTKSYDEPFSSFEIY